MGHDVVEEDIASRRVITWSVFPPFFLHGRTLIADGSDNYAGTKANKQFDLR